MKKLGIIAIAMLLIGLPWSVSAQDTAGGTPEPAVVVTGGDHFEQIEVLVEKMLKGYNDQDFKAFYADFAQAMAAIATEQAFKALYTDMYMAQHGKCVSRKLVKEKSVVSDDAPVGLAVYSAVFEKNEKIQISVNVMKEEGGWKLMQVQFGPEQ